MTSRPAIKKFIVYLVLIAFTAGCTTMRPLPTTRVQSLATQLVVGDEVEIVRNDSTEVTFEVTVVSDEGISGGGVFVAYSDIRQIQVRQHSTAKTVALVVAIVLAVGAIAAGSADYGLNCGRCFGGPK